MMHSAVAKDIWSVTSVCCANCSGGASAHM